jgi:endoglucanase
MFIAYQTPQPVWAQVDILRNGDFSSSADYWKKTDFYQNYQYGPRLATSHFYVEKGQAIINVTENGSQPWHAHLIQAGLVLEQGSRYELSFDARFQALPGQSLPDDSTLPLTISVIREWGGLQVYFEDVVTHPYPNRWQRFKLSFVAPADDDFARLDINFGKHGLGATEADQFQLRLDNVRLQNVNSDQDPRQVSDGNGQRQPVLDMGQLSVDNQGRLYSALQDRPVQLRGMSLHGIQWDHGWYFANRETLLELKEQWHIDAIRIPLYLGQGGIIDNPSIRLSLDYLVRQAAALNLYVIIDWHVHNDAGDPNRYVNEAKRFFRKIAAQYGDQEAVIFEICNEPNGVSWSSIKRYADQVIPIIREHSDNVIIVGTPTWSQDVDSVVADPVDADHILYGFHFYAASHSLNQFKRKIDSARQNGLGIFVSEWGTTNFGGDGQPNLRESKAWLDYLARQGISWMNWNLSAENEESAALRPTAHPVPSQVGGWTDADLTKSGRFVKERLRQPSSFNPNQPPSQPTPAPKPPENHEISTEVAIESDWGDGYCANVIVTNATGSAVFWDIQFEIEGTIQNAWNAQWVQKGSTVYASAPQDAASLAPGDSVQWGFCATRASGSA